MSFAFHLTQSACLSCRLETVTSIMSTTPDSIVTMGQLGFVFLVAVVFFEPPFFADFFFAGFFFAVFFFADFLIADFFIAYFFFPVFLFMSLSFHHGRLGADPSSDPKGILRLSPLLSS